METNTLAHVPLSEITASETNKVFRDNFEMSDQGLKELADSIKEKGVISPILLRVDPTNAKRKILVAGERRWRASILAGIKSIPAYIKAMTEDEAFDYQITENVQRKDIHPLNEAAGFKLILEKHPETTTAELAIRFGKSESYILLRLKLNDLIPAAKKDFASNKMMLGHALILAKLTPDDQKDCVLGDNRSSSYGTVLELQEYVNREIMTSLNSAPFSLEDAELVAKAGACNQCPKRSGNCPSLFPELKKKDDVCIDKKCFKAKCSQHLFNSTKEVIETKPEVVLITDYRGVSENLQEMISDNKIKVLKEYDDFSSHDTKGTKVRALWVSGNNAGKMTTIHLRRIAEAKHGETANQQTLISKIQERTTRGKELDQEKIYGKILDSIRVHPTQKKDTSKKMLPEEEVFLWFIIFDKAGFNLRNELSKLFHINRDNPEKVFISLKALTVEQRAFMLRRVMMDQYSGIYPNGDYAYIIRNIAEAYKDIPIKTIEMEQAEIATKREIRAKERIKAIRQESKTTTKKKERKSKTK